jgi:transposase
MRFVPVKSLEQQAVLSIHRVRQGFVEERTATINRIRGLLSEFRLVLPQKAIAVRRGLPSVLDRLPVLAARALTDLYAHLSLLDERIRDYERQIVHLARQNEAACRLMAITGVGPIIALAMVATVGDARSFDSGRQFAAWLGVSSQAVVLGRQDTLGAHHT